MEDYRDLITRFYLCTNRMDGLYYQAARKLGVNENDLSLLYFLLDGPPRSQKQLSEDLNIPKTTVNTIVREYVQAGYARLVPGDRGKEREVVLTQAGRDYALPILRPLYAAEERAMARTLERFSPEFLLAVEAMTDYLDQAIRDEILEDEKEER